ncbi:hypothetical protein K402DRAFT_454658 [Aulographum hederae CBS 113979]|uniref:Uncharacterized protein n=1 Tax=Aulographum hederae CBS 113979 TaxID=1176131 RepID=A0A6G1GYD5_9PEZI|nr:hypothetical protein K402DRAFT_454658 [Aulographum hederae CBS 113979]
MSFTSMWEGNLLNSPSDVIIDILILFAILFTSILQISKVYSVGSFVGISPYFLLFNALFDNIQLASMVLDAAYAWPSDGNPLLRRIADGDLRGFEAFGGLMGPLQIALQWVYPIALIILYSRSHPASNNTNNRNTGLSVRKTVIATTVFLHAVIFLFPTFPIALPRPKQHRFDMDLFIGFSTIVALLTAPVFILLRFVSQFMEMRHMEGKPGALSLLALSLQTALMFLMAGRWLLRLGMPTWEWRTVRAPLSLWYSWGFVAVNHFLQGLGCVILLGWCLFSRKGVDGVGQESSPLLG